jgi:hypothetical protein
MCTTAQPFSGLSPTIIWQDVWIIIAAGIVVGALFVARLRFTDESDLGSVTETWLAEYRADQAADPK